MLEITNVADFNKAGNGNTIISSGNNVVFNKSRIKFNGKNNVVIIEDGVNIENSTILLNGSGSVCYICKNRHKIYLNLTIYNNQFFFVGENTYFNGILTVIMSEEKSVFIGDNCMFSYGITMRNADPHLIYDCDSHERINYSKSIFLGDHVWIGQSALILKGAKIHSGSIIGAASVVAGKDYFSNNVYGGNPSRLIRENVFWDGSCVHAWTQTHTKQYAKKDCDDYIYNYNADEYLDFEEIEKKFNGLNDMDSKVEFLKSIRNNKNKNRFSKMVSL
ncbi:acyltransferase [Bacillus sp. 179-C3.3 HS]|uniref:acyltransferase n=1 Tax=Bacillus sp. 179-C3.3 HS TaxID=3232162 RepID=UPI0039A20D4F